MRYEVKLIKQRFLLRTVALHVLLVLGCLCKYVLQEIGEQAAKDKGHI